MSNLYECVEQSGGYITIWHCPVTAKDEGFFVTEETWEKAGGVPVRHIHGYRSSAITS